MAFENKFGKSAVDAARNNALPPYLDILFREGGAGGADIEVLELFLSVDDWDESNGILVQTVMQESVVSDGSEVILLSAEGEIYPISGAGIKLTSIQLNPESNIASFIFSATEQPIEEIKAIVLVITSNSAVSARFRDILNELNGIYGNCISVQNQVNQAASNASISATNAANSANDAAGSATSAAADAAVCSGIVSDAAAALQSQLHPVGSTYITSTNINPSSILGIGTWELYDKEFASYSSTTSILTTSSTISTVSGFLLIRKGHDIIIRFQLILSGELGFGNYDLASFTTSNIGLTSAFADWSIVGNSPDNTDAVDGIVLAQLNGSNNNTTFTLGSKSIVTRISERKIPSGSTVSFLLRPLFTFDQMMDSVCNKFYWRRTA